MIEPKRYWIGVASPYGSDRALRAFVINHTGLLYVQDAEVLPDLARCAVPVGAQLIVDG